MYNSSPISPNPDHVRYLSGHLIWVAKKIKSNLNYYTMTGHSNVMLATLECLGVMEIYVVKKMPNQSQQNKELTRLLANNQIKCVEGSYELSEQTLRTFTNTRRVAYEQCCISVKRADKARSLEWNAGTKRSEKRYETNFKEAATIKKKMKLHQKKVLENLLCSIISKYNGGENTINP